MCKFCQYYYKSNSSIQKQMPQWDPYPSWEKHWKARRKEQEAEERALRDYYGSGFEMEK